MARTHKTPNAKIAISHLDEKITIKYNKCGRPKKKLTAYKKLRYKQVHPSPVQCTWITFPTLRHTWPAFCQIPIENKFFFFFNETRAEKGLEVYSIYPCLWPLRNATWRVPASAPIGIHTSWSRCSLWCCDSHDFSRGRVVKFACRSIFACAGFHVIWAVNSTLWKVSSNLSIINFSKLLHMQI